jgi:hypothetical protein
MVSTSNQRERRFHQILDEEYRHALRSPAVAPGALPEGAPPAPQRAGGMTRRVLGFVVAGVGVAAMLRILRRARTRSAGQT